MDVNCKRVPLEVIEQWLKDEDWRVRTAAMNACQGREVPLEVIEQWLKDEDCDVRTAAVNACQANNITIPVIRTIEPPDLVYKKCVGGIIVVASIPQDAQIRGSFGNKCRANKAVIKEIIGDLYGERVGISKHDLKTLYYAGDKVEIENFDLSNKECSTGFNFFCTKREAEEYYGEAEPEGILAILYRALCVMAEMRDRLSAYEDTGLELEEFEAVAVLDEYEVQGRSEPLEFPKREAEVLLAWMREQMYGNAATQWKYGNEHDRMFDCADLNRSDKVRLDNVFSRIIFQRDLRWGIENGYLCNIYCLRVNIGYDLTAVHTRHGDYAPGELDEAMDGTADAIAQAYREHAQGATLIFAVSVRHAQEIADKIPGAVVVTGQTKDRASIIQAFTDGEIPCIVNCMVFTEGTDIPRVETVIIARPTQSDSLFAQMVGRGVRTYPGKDKLILIDCVGTTGRASLCTAPSLLGIDMSAIPESKRAEVQGDLFELPIRAAAASDCPESWIRNVEIVDLWAKEQKYQTHDVNWFKMPSGELVCSLGDKKKMRIPCPDALGTVHFKNGTTVTMQEALDLAYTALKEKHGDQQKLWDRNAVKR